MSDTVDAMRGFKFGEGWLKADGGAVENRHYLRGVDPPTPTESETANAAVL